MRYKEVCNKLGIMSLKSGWDSIWTNACLIMSWCFWRLHHRFCFHQLLYESQNSDYTLLTANHWFISIDLHNARSHLMQGTFLCRVGRKILWLLQLLIVQQTWWNLPIIGIVPCKTLPFHAFPLGLKSESCSSTDNAPHCLTKSLSKGLTFLPMGSCSFMGKDSHVPLSSK